MKRLASDLPEFFLPQRFQLIFGNGCMESSVQGHKSLKVLAAVALLLSLGSLFDLSWTLWRHFNDTPCGNRILSRFFSLSALVGFVVGLATFKRVVSRNLAILAMVFGMPALSLTISNFRPMYSLELGRETAAIQTLRSIHNNQAQFQAMKDRFGTLEDLVSQGLLDEAYKKGQPISGYIYSSTNVTAETYCVRAYRFYPKCGSRDFIVCEDGDIRYAESTSIKVLNRGEGLLLSGPNFKFPTPTVTP